MSLNQLCVCIGGAGGNFGWFITDKCHLWGKQDCHIPVTRIIRQTPGPGFLNIETLLNMRTKGRSEVNYTVPVPKAICDVNNLISNTEFTCFHVSNCQRNHALFIVEESTFIGSMLLSLSRRYSWPSRQCNFQLLHKKNWPQNCSASGKFLQELPRARPMGHRAGCDWLRVTEVGENWPMRGEDEGASVEAGMGRWWVSEWHILTSS